MIPSSSNLVIHGFFGFKDWFGAFEFLLPQGRLVRVEILRQFPHIYGFTHDIHQGAWPMTPNTEKQTSNVSLDDFVVTKVKRK